LLLLRPRLVLKILQNFSDFLSYQIFDTCMKH
jgi:hypothetical protein